MKINILPFFTFTISLLLFSGNNLSSLKDSRRSVRKKSTYSYKKIKSPHSASSLLKKSVSDEPSTQNTEQFLATQPATDAHVDMQQQPQQVVARVRYDENERCSALEMRNFLKKLTPSGWKLRNSGESIHEDDIIFLQGEWGQIKAFAISNTSQYDLFVLYDALDFIRGTKTALKLVQTVSKVPLYRTHDSPTKDVVIYTMSKSEGSPVLFTIHGFKNINRQRATKDIRPMSVGETIFIKVNDTEGHPHSLMMSENIIADKLYPMHMGYHEKIVGAAFKDQDSSSSPEIIPQEFVSVEGVGPLMPKLEGTEEITSDSSYKKLMLITKKAKL